MQQNYQKIIRIIFFIILGIIILKGLNKILPLLILAGLFVFVWFTIKNRKLPLKQQHKFINNIFYKAKKLSTIINVILRASEMDTDEFELIPANIKPTQAEELVRSVYEDLKPEADEKGLKLELGKPKKNVAKILADSDFLEQAIYNLADRDFVDYRPYVSNLNTGAVAYANTYVNNEDGRRLWLSLNVDF